MDVAQRRPEIMDLENQAMAFYALLKEEVDRVVMEGNEGRTRFVDGYVVFLPFAANGSYNSIVVGGGSNVNFTVGEGGLVINVIKKGDKLYQNLSLDDLSPELVCMVEEAIEIQMKAVLQLLGQSKLRRGLGDVWAQVRMRIWLEISLLLDPTRD